MPKYKLKHGKYREANKTESGQLRRKDGKTYRPGDIVELSEAQAERWSDMVELVLEQTPIQKAPVAPVVAKPAAKPSEKKAE